MLYADQEGLGLFPTRGRIKVWLWPKIWPGPS